MIISVNTKKIEIPDTIDLSELTEQGGWLYDVFQEVATLKKTGAGIWSYTFTTLFSDTNLTDMHKYCICMAFSALITSLELSEQFTEFVNVTIPEVIQNVAKQHLPALYFAGNFIPKDSFTETDASPSENFVPM